jgi:hypothetical protein
LRSQSVCPERTKSSESASSVARNRLRFSRTDYRRLARRNDAIEPAGARNEDSHEDRPSRVPRNERARVPRPHPLSVPLAASRA